MKKKALLLTVSVILLILTVFSASAADIKIPEFTSDSTFSPVDCNSHSATSTVKLYGNIDYICMKAVVEKSYYVGYAYYDNFYLKIYSDSSYKNLKYSYANNFSDGTRYVNIPFDFSGVKDGTTFYAVSYVEKVNFKGVRKKDESTVKKFKIVIDRDATSMSKMHTVMYGYANTYYGPQVYWYSVPGATGYYVYRYQNKEYQKIATVKAGSDAVTSYIDKESKTKNASLKYKVVAYNSGGKTTLSQIPLELYYVVAPTVSVSHGTDSYVKVKWNSVGSDYYYAVLRRTANTDWEIVDEEVRTTTYSEKPDKNDTDYYYSVMAYSERTMGAFHPTGKKIHYMQAPDGLNAAAEGDAIRFSWNAVGGADRYVVYRKAGSASADWVNMGAVTGTSFLDTSIEKNKQYIYTVRSCKATTNGSYDYDGVRCANVEKAVMKSAGINSDFCPLIKWTHNGSGLTYYVYRKGPSDASWVYVGSTSSKHYIDRSQTLKVGNEYSYIVNTKFSTFGESGYSDNEVKCTYYKKITEISFMPETDSSIRLNWTKINGASKYNVYRKSADSEYQLIGEATSNSFSDSSVIVGVDYTYKVTFVIGEKEYDKYGCEKTCSVFESSATISPATIIEDNVGRFIVKLQNTEDAARYDLYEITEKGYINVEMATADSPSFTVRNEKNGKIAEYAIAQRRTDGSGVTFIKDAGLTIEHIRLSAPEVKANHSNGTVTVSIPPVEGAQEYYIYRTINHNETSATVTEPVYNDTSAQAGADIYYNYGCLKNNVVYNYNSSVGTYLIPVPAVKAANGKTGVTVSWNSCGQKYVVYRKAEGDTSWTKLKTVPGKTEYTDTSAVGGTTYYYTVRPYHSNYGYGGYDKVGAKVLRLKAPKITKVTLYSTGVSINWEKTEGAERYQVYRKTSSSGWKVIYTTKNAKVLKYTDKTVTAGVKYYYAVRAVGSDTRSTYISKTVPFMSAPKLVSATSTSSGIKVTFKSSPLATYYYVYRKQGTGEFTLVGKVSKNATSYVDKTAEKGVQYTYTVRAYSSGVLSSRYSGVRATRK